MTNIICRSKEINILASKTIAGLCGVSSRKVPFKNAIFDTGTRRKVAAIQKARNKTEV